MAKIYAPNKEYCGVSATVPFVNGVGETDKENLIEWFKSKGYEVEEIQEPDNSAVNQEPPAGNPEGNENVDPPADETSKKGKK